MDEFRLALRHFASGVTIVTVRDGEAACGLTVSAFASVSAVPPLVLVVIENGRRACPLLQEDGAAFAVNILAEDQAALSDRFAWLKDEDRFAEGRWGTGVTGAPVLLDALVWLDCRVHARHPAGSHTIFIGAVEASQVARPDTPPLVYWNRGYRKLELED